MPSKILLQISGKGQIGTIHLLILGGSEEPLVKGDRVDETLVVLYLLLKIRSQFAASEFRQTKLGYLSL